MLINNKIQRKLEKNSVLELNGISKSYQKNIALNNISFTWKNGILGLIGPNGAGKSTLIKILSTLIRPDTGYARIYGKDIVKEGLEVRKKIGVLHENPIFHPNLKVSSSLCWMGELRGLTRENARSQSNELLEYFGLSSTLNFRIKELSAGMRQKYGLINATIGTPRFILLDEPTSNLDPDARKNYESYINELVKNDDCSFLISSHVLTELDRLCNGFIFLFRGKILESGKRSSLEMKSLPQKFRMLTNNPEIALSTLTKYKIKIKQILDKEIVISVQNYDKLLEVYSVLKQKDKTEGIELLPMETKLESLYRHLSDQQKD